MENIRKKIYETIEAGQQSTKQGQIYDIVMMLTIVVSLIPLATKSTSRVFVWMDTITVVIFIIDYLLRLVTADLKLQKGKSSFIRYPFTFLAIVDLLSILPSITVLNSGLRLLKVFRLLRTFRALKIIRYSKNIRRVANVLKKQKEGLLVIGAMAIGYILMVALIIFNIEPGTFDTYFDAIYWATISLTTVGYGDIYPVSDVGRVITMISSLVGIAVVALPSGIITAGYMDELREESNKLD